MTLAEAIRNKREQLDLGLRHVAREVGISAPYLCDIEYGRRLPSDKILRKLSAHLGLDFDYLQGLVGRMDNVVKQYVRSRPLAGRLFREIALRDLDEFQLGAIQIFVSDLTRPKLLEGNRPPASSPAGR